MFFQESDIREVTQTVWHLVLNTSAKYVDPRPLPQANDDLVSGAVQVNGSWNGAITIFCSMNLARNAAAQMYNSTPEGVPDPDVYDAMGELANMIGGNVRALLPEPCQLSLPTVVASERVTLQSHDTVLFEMTFTSVGQPFWIRLTEAK